MRDEVERKVERRDERARADRHALHEAAITVGALGDFEIDDLAVDAHGFLGGDLERVDEARDFALRILDRFAGLDAQRHRELVEALTETRDAMFEHGLPRVRRERAHRRFRSDRRGDGHVDRLRVGERDARGDVAGVFVTDFERVVRLRGFVRQIVGIAVLRHGDLRYGRGNAL